MVLFFFFHAEDGIRDGRVTGVQTCALPISYFSQALAQNTQLLPRFHNMRFNLGVGLNQLASLTNRAGPQSGQGGLMENCFEMYRTIVMPAHCDHYGHMNVRHYAAFFDDAGWQMLARAGVSLRDLRDRGLGSVVATLTIDFHHEIKAGELALIMGSFTRVGKKSFAYDLKLYEVDSMTHCATQKTVEVCFDLAKRASVALPDDIRDKLAKLFVG